MNTLCVSLWLILSLWLVSRRVRRDLGSDVADTVHAYRQRLAELEGEP